MSDNVILLGNSLNLLEDQGKAWENLVKKCEDSLEGGNVSPDAYENVKKYIPLIFRMSRFFNEWKWNSDKSDAKNEENAAENELVGKEAFITMCCEISELPHSAMHKKLFDLVGDSNILTTNYDYAVESCLGIEHGTVKKFEGELQDLMSKRELSVLHNLTRHNGRVWHIHGEACEPESIIIDSDGYAKGLVALKNYGDNNGSWLKLFLHSTVHIVGLEFRHTESLLWYALQARLNIQESDRKEVYYYHFTCDDDESRTKSTNLEILLKSFDVTFIRIPVSEPYNYKAAWGKLIKTLKQKMHPDKTVNFRPFRSSNPAYNIVATTTPTSQNQERCWMNIGVEKLKGYAEADALWYFDCNVRGERLVYKAKAKAVKGVLKNIANIIENGTERYSFYIDYKKGLLFKTISADEPLLELEKITDGADYKPYKMSKGNK